MYITVAVRHCPIAPPAFQITDNHCPAASCHAYPDAQLGGQVSEHALYIMIISKVTKLRGLSPRANYTDLASAACRRS
jgi:hypothetical protein